MPAANPMQWCWLAIYSDGEQLKQFENGVESSSEKIDRKKLSEFRLLKNNVPVFRAFFKQDGSRKLVFRRRTLLNAAGQVKDRVYLVGWHENVRGVSVKSICYIYSDGHIEFDDDRSDLELVECEK